MAAQTQSRAMFSNCLNCINYYGLEMWQVSGNFSNLRSFILSKQHLGSPFVVYQARTNLMDKVEQLEIARHLP